MQQGSPKEPSVTRTTEEPLVTIGIPTFNRAGTYLPAALESALLQTYSNIEILVSDNSSSDNTPELVRGYHDRRIRYVRQSPPLLPNENFNYCLNQATGRWFVLLHDDDVLDPGFVESCIAVVDDDAIGIVRTGTRLIDEEGNAFMQRPNPVPSGAPFRALLDAWFDDRTGLYLCSTLFNADRLRMLGGFGSRHHLLQDVLAELELAARFGHREVPTVLAGFRRHRGEYTYHNAVRAWYEDSKFVMDRLRPLIGDDPELVERAEYFFNRLNYRRAMEARGLGRIRAISWLLQASGFRRWPPTRMLLPRRLRDRISTG